MAPEVSGYLPAAAALVAALPLVVAALVVLRNRRRWKPATACGTLLLVGGLAAAAGLGFWLAAGGAGGTRAASVLPVATDQGFVGSDSCRGCHASQHDTWHASYHRTMTQPATPETVVASFDDVRLQTAGMHATLFRRGDQFWVDMVDPYWVMQEFGRGKDASLVDNPPRSRHQIVMTTGSHHFQVYWYRSERGRELWQFPWRYQIAERRWIHRRDVFLTNEPWIPGLQFQAWNRNCILCHCTGGKPGQDPDSGVMDRTEVAELGIACEACHGPGERHVLMMRSLQTRQQPPAGDLAIVNPARLPHDLSSQVCGRCHSHLKHTDHEVLTTGTNYRPGERLTDFGVLLTAADEERRLRRYWSDGVNCSGGREFSGMIDSACYLQGQMSCLSCHSMHGGPPDQQLTDSKDSNEACYRCHASYRENLAQHTHHGADSAGSRCYNCHMAYTSFALLKAIRNHRIDSPRVESMRGNGRPNACNLCHLDQTLEWTAEHLRKWHGQPQPELNEEDRTVAAGVQWMLKGDPVQRAVVAWHLGWQPAQEASGTEWMPAYLSDLLKDEVAAVRWAAGVSLRSLPGYEAIQVEDDESPASRSLAARQTVDIWQRQPPDQAEREMTPRARQLLFQAPRELDDRFLQLRKQRDKQIFTLVE